MTKLKTRGLAAALATLCAGPVGAFEARHFGDLTAQATANARLGMQYGTGINFGLGALDGTRERNRSSLAASIKPKLTLDYAATPATHLYGGVSVAAAVTSLDGEISGQFARAGDTQINTDDAYFGLRSGVLDVSVGAQEFWVGDGLLIGDGNFDLGPSDGQYWVVPFAAWRNSAIVKLNTSPLRAEAFWLRSDRDFGDSRVVGVNVETSGWAFEEYGKLGAMHLDILDGNRFHYDGMEVYDLRASGVKLPGLKDLTFFGEFVREVGRDSDGGRPNDAIGWYVEGQYHLPRLPLNPTFAYRYAHFSGDDPKTRDNEEYRGLFYSFYKREWDTWYMGEIASEYHLFNENQNTQMFKLKLAPDPKWAYSAYYYHHELDTKQYLGTPVSSTDWAEEINLQVEYFLGHRFYGYAGIIWSTPNRAAREIYGPDDFTVLQTWLSYTF
ncbi:MAG: hypothetical protein HY943_00260 [Gammaproteobacteria bacterium]|nr:hypothetical protein [Gammaproteobacteria bacterium]